jgi:Flp pilus assembly protein TadD
MKTRNFRALVLATAVGVGSTGCSLVKDVTYTVTPNPLEMCGDSVEVTINAIVGDKGLHKKATADITPMIMWEGGQKELKTISVQGEAAAGNGIVIPKAGKKVTYTDKVPYSNDMQTSELKVKLVAKKGKKTVEEVSDKIADGVITTPYLLIGDDKSIAAKDQFKRVTPESVPAVIHYTVNNSTVRGGELKDADVKAMKAFITANAENPKVAYTSVAVQAWASPEGEISKNDNLANERAASAGKSARGLFNKTAATKLEGVSDNLAGRGEDWEGFKAAMQASNIKDKELILRVLEMYSDKTKREEEIKNMAQTYLELKKEILPSLRRSEISLKYDLTGKSDAELTALSKSNPDSLTVEELLFSATLTGSDMNEQMRIYKEVSRIYPSDWRGPNNVGYIYMMQNKLNDASGEFEKAAGIAKDPVVMNNLGVVARLKGDRAKAMEYYGQASGAGPEVAYNMGIVQIQDCQYAAAVGSFGSEKTVNAALAQMLSGDTDGALNTIDASPDKDSAMGYYLKAVIGARTGNGDLVANNLKSAVAKDAAMKEKAEKDLEFLKYRKEDGGLGL